MQHSGSVPERTRSAIVGRGARPIAGIGEGSSAPEVDCWHRPSIAGYEVGGQILHLA